MKSFLSKSYFFRLPLVGLVMFMSCDMYVDDVAPAAFEEFTLYPDDVWDYNLPDQTSLLRLDPLFNDSIKTEVQVTFGTPKHGRFIVEPDGFTYYTPEPGYIGVDSLTYTACSDLSCKTEKIRIYLEGPVDPENCTMMIRDEQVQTSMNKFVDIRIFANDEICGSLSASYFFPEKGSWEDISYSGSHLYNKIFRYYPPKDYVGVDTFEYQVSNSDGTEIYIGVVTISII